MTFKSSAAGLAGRARMMQIARENAVEIAKHVAHLLQGLKRPATAGEEIEADLMASTYVKSLRLRETGRDDSVERQLLKELMRTTVFGSAPEPSPAERQHGRAVAAAYEAHDRDRAVDAMATDQPAD